MRALVYGPPPTMGNKVACVTRDGRAFVRERNDNGLRSWQGAMREAMLADQPPEMPQDGIAVAVTVVVARPKGHFGKRGLLPSARRAPTVKPDACKIQRALYDCLSGIWCPDDSHVIQVQFAKRYQTPGDPLDQPRVEVWALAL